MTREQTIEAIRIMQSWVDGKELEVREVDEWRRTFIPLWQWHTNDYRIKPTPVLRPWTADEVPVGGQIRNKAIPEYRWLIDRTADLTVRNEWLERHEHSIDGGKTWLPCGVVEESK
jgi:hypothetical protein